jgi:MFS family permease
MLVGLGVVSFVRRDPKDISASYPAERAEPATAATLREILRRPGVPTAVFAVVASFSVMASVMNLAGYVAVGRGHHEGDVFTMISAHILGMYALVLVVGNVVDRVGRRITLVAGLLLMAVSNLSLVWLGGLGGMSVALLGLGLGWNLSYVAATTELVALTSPSERGRLVGFTDLCASLTAAALALLGGLVYSGAGVVALSLAAAAVAAVPAAWLAARPAPRVTALPAAD